MTFPKPGSFIMLRVSKTSDIDVDFEFRTLRPNAVIVYMPTIENTAKGFADASFFLIS